MIDKPIKELSYQIGTHDDSDIVLIYDEEAIYDILVRCKTSSTGAVDIGFSSDGSTYNFVYQIGIGEQVLLKDIYCNYCKIAIASGESINYYVVKKK